MHIDACHTYIWYNRTKNTKITTNLITKYFQTDVSVIVIDIT